MDGQNSSPLDPAGQHLLNVTVMFSTPSAGGSSSIAGIVLTNLNMRFCNVFSVGRLGKSDM